MKNKQKDKEKVMFDDDEVEEVKDFVISDGNNNENHIEGYKIAEALNEQLLEAIQENSTNYGIDEGIVICERINIFILKIKKELYKQLDNESDDFDDSDEGLDSEDDDTGQNEKT